MSTDEQLVTESLRRLAQHAPTFAPQVEQQERRRGRVLAPLLAAAAVLVLIGAGVVLAGDSDPDPQPAPVPTPPAQEQDGPALRLSGAEELPREAEPSCATWNPPPVDTIIGVDTLTDDCISKAQLGVTTVLIARYDAAGVLGVPWEDATALWRTIDGAEVRRLSGGPLAEMSSQYVDGLTCAACDQVILVLGPDPAHVRDLVESVREGSQFPPNPADLLDCPGVVHGYSVDGSHQRAPSPRAAVEELLGEQLRDTEVVNWLYGPYAVLVPDAPRHGRTVVLVLRNQAGTWDAVEVYDCRDD